MWDPREDIDLHLRRGQGQAASAESVSLRALSSTGTMRPRCALTCVWLWDQSIFKEGCD